MTFNPLSSIGLGNLLALQDGRYVREIVTRDLHPEVGRKRRLRGGAKVVRRKNRGARLLACLAGNVASLTRERDYAGFSSRIAPGRSVRGLSQFVVGKSERLMERPTSSQVFGAPFPRHEIDRAGFSW